MKKSRFSDSQIVRILKQAEAGTPVPSLCREHGVSSATFYKWRSKYGGMDASLIGKMKELEIENTKLKKMYAEAQLAAEMLKEALSEMAPLIWAGIFQSEVDSPLSSRDAVRQQVEVNRIRRLPVRARAMFWLPRPCWPVPE